MELLGLHHVTAMTDDVERNYHFFTEVLGMRLVKKTVNQDDIQTYHTFYADDRGNAGTDMTFFDFPNQPKGIRGTNSITRTGLRVPNDEALAYYLERFEQFGIKHKGIQAFLGTKVLPFEEADGQRYQLFSDEHNEGVEAGIPWQNGPVPVDKAIYGLGPVEITVSYFDDMKRVLQEVYGMRAVVDEADLAVLDMGKGGNGGRVILRKDTTSSQAQEGYGAVHHVAFRVSEEAELRRWWQAYRQANIASSGLINRYYFKALYARIGHILFEIATDGPGFMGDEPYETLGEKLSLPPFLEDKRAVIEAEVRPFNTVRQS